MKWILSLIKVTIQTAMICTITLATTWYVVHLYVDDVLQQFNLSTPEHKMQLSNMISFFTTASGLGQTDISSGMDPQIGGGVSPPPETNPPLDDHSLPVDSADQDFPDQPAVPAWTQDQANSLYISADEFMTRKDSLTDEEKWRIFEIILKLPQDKMIRLSELIEGGITESEFVEMDQILSEYIEYDEYQEIMKIVGEY